MCVTDTLLVALKATVLCKYIYSCRPMWRCVACGFDLQASAILSRVVCVLTLTESLF